MRIARDPVSREGSRAALSHEMNSAIEPEPVFDTFPWPQFEESCEANEGSEREKMTSPPSRDTLACRPDGGTNKEMKRFPWAEELLSLGHHASNPG